MKPAQLVWVGMAVIFVGFMVVFIGAFQGSSGSASTGGFILIGPIPIIFGNGPNSGSLAPVAVAISVVMIAIYLLSFFASGQGRRREARLEPKSE